MFELKQYLQSYNAGNSIKTEISSFTNAQSLVTTKTARRDYNKLLPGFVMSQKYIYINPTPGNMQQRGQGHVELEGFF